MHRKWWQVGDHPIYDFVTLAFYSAVNTRGATDCYTFTVAYATLIV